MSRSELESLIKEDPEFRLYPHSKLIFEEHSSGNLFTAFCFDSLEVYCAKLSCCNEKKHFSSNKYPIWGLDESDWKYLSRYDIDRNKISFAKKTKHERVHRKGEIVRYYLIYPSKNSEKISTFYRWDTSKYCKY